MPYFSISSHPQMPLVVVKLTDRRPKATDKDGFRLKYIAEVSELDAIGADMSIGMLDERMGTATKAAGVYQADYGEVRRNFDDIVREHASRPAYSNAERIACGAAAALLLCAMCAVAIPAAIVWLAISAFKKQSGLLTMAETAVVFSIFDWTPLIKKLGRIARYGH